MTDVKFLLDEATPLPWEIEDTTDSTIDLCCGEDGVEHQHPKTAWFRGDVGSVDVGDYNTLSLADGELIEYAVNRLPDYEAAVDALERISLAGRMYKEREFDSYHALMRAIEDGRAALHRLREGVPA